LLAVLSPAHLRANLLVKLGEVTGRTHALPIVLYAPTARCNSRCVSCDWWRSDGAGELSKSEIAALAAELPRFGTRVVVLTGGEPLVRPDIMEVADLFRARGMTLHLLTSGLALERFAADIAARFAEVTISLDGHTPELYRAIRGVDGLGAVIAGVRALRRLGPHVTLRARGTLSRHNFRALPDLVAQARELELDQISFLAADVTSDAFNRPADLRRPDLRPPDLRQPGLPALPRADAARAPERLLLDEAEVAEFEDVIEATIQANARALAEERVVPGADGLRRLARYYRAHLGQGPFPAVDCNAPWASVFIGADGALRPCFFHPPVGNIRERPLADLLTVAMPAFRTGLDVASDAVCRRCVCTLKTGLRSKLW
jgi:MoaA/NifB/PqqE/SkfB family radical SAM enzyme